MNRTRNLRTTKPFPRLSRAAALILSGAILGSAAFAADGAAAPKQTSSCIACHTDAEKLKAEAAKIPPAAGSALQAGKG